MKYGITYALLLSLCVFSGLIAAKKLTPQQQRLAKIKEMHAKHRALYQQPGAVAPETKQPETSTASSSSTGLESSTAAAAVSTTAPSMPASKRAALARARAAAAQKASVPDKPWVCPSCTYQNPAKTARCEMCATPWPGKGNGAQGGEEKAASAEDKALLEKLNKEMAQLTAKQKSVQADIESAKSSESDAKKKGQELNLVAPLQKQLGEIEAQIKAKQSEIDKVMQKTAAQVQMGTQSKEDAEMEKAMAESLKDAAKRAEDAKTSQEALAKAAEAAKALASRRTSVPTLPLVNVGATCFANATLQCLFQLPALQTAVFGLGDSRAWQSAHPKLTKDAINFIAAYQQLVIALQDWTATTAFTPSAFCAAMRTRVFAGAHGMQDAAQFFSVFADDVGELCGKSPFDVSVNSSIVCHTCSKKSEKIDTEKFLALSIAGNTLGECLTQYMQGDELKAPNQYFCATCKAKRDATKTLKVVSLPVILVLQLKRYTGSKTTAITKIDTAVSFPLALSQDAFYQGDEKAAGVTYDLVGMVNHNGSFGGGHYTSYVKSGTDAVWHFCDDTQIAVSTEEQVKKVADAGVDAGYRKATPYLLFYLRRPASAS